VGGVDVRGPAPGTRETDLLRAENSVDRIHGIVLSGGSAYGLAAASGVMRLLEAEGVGHRVGQFIIPIVPSAILFDLGMGEPGVRPGEGQGIAAAENASSRAVAQGTVGAGTGATVGKALGRAAAMKGGIGSASMDLGDGIVLAALVAVNAVGGIVDPTTGEIIAGPHDKAGGVRDSIVIYADPGYGARVSASRRPEPLGNTTLGIVATTAALTSGQANRLAAVAHDGLALAIRPCHTLHDGDTVFTLATGAVDAPDDVPRLYALTPTVVAQAIVNAVTNATSLHGVPSVSEVRSRA
jgi:L-aminopeptidase/D-esterase-like protein